jgi:hypothetical protein
MKQKPKLFSALHSLIKAYVSVEIYLYAFITVTIKMHICAVIFILRHMLFVFFRDKGYCRVLPMWNAGLRSF